MYRIDVPHVPTQRRVLNNILTQTGMEEEQGQMIFHNINKSILIF